MTKARRTNLFFLGMVVFYLISCFLILPLLPDKLLSNNSSIIIGQSLVIIPTVFYLIFTKGKPLKDIPFKSIGALNIFLLIIFTYCMLPVISLINTISMIFAKNEIAVQLDSMGSNHFLINIFLVALVPALVEEFVFRGIIYGGYRNSIIKRGILLSGLLFGLFHMNFNQFCYAFFMGIVFALLREGTGSIHSSMIVHFVFNANSVILLKIIDIYTNYVNKMAQSNDSFKEIADMLNEQSESTATYADFSVAEKIGTIIPIFIMAVVGGIIAFILFRVIVKRCHREKHIKRILASFVGKKYVDNGIINTEDYVEICPESYGGKVIDFVSVLAIILCILMMIYVAIV